MATGMSSCSRTCFGTLLSSRTVHVPSAIRSNGPVMKWKYSFCNTPTDHPLEHLSCASVFPESANLLASVILLLKISFHFIINFNLLLVLNGLALKLWLWSELLREGPGPPGPPSRSATAHAGANMHTHSDIYLYCACSSWLQLL